jgi:hypothetical protein
MNFEQKILEQIINDLKNINNTIEDNQKSFDYVLAYSLIEEAVTNLSERYKEIQENKKEEIK